MLAEWQIAWPLGHMDPCCWASLPPPAPHPPPSVQGPIDFNQYLGIQRMGIACLQLPPARVRTYAETFSRRAQVLVAALRGMGWDVRMPKACMYVWAPLPAGLDDMVFCKALVAQTGVALSPGRGFGPGGVGFVRFALVQPSEVLAHCAARIAAFIDEHGDALRAHSAVDGAAAVCVTASVTSSKGTCIKGLAPCAANGHHRVSADLYDGVIDQA